MARRATAAKRGRAGDMPPDTLPFHQTTIMKERVSSSEWQQSGEQVKNSMAKKSIGVIFIGRNNREKRSNALLRLATALESDGLDVLTFKSDRIEASERVNLRLEAALPSLAQTQGNNHPLHLRLLRLALKGLIVLKTKQLWAYLDAPLRPKPYTLAREIHAFLNRSQWSKVYLISHSAGGIAATKVSENPKVAGIFCFGYPFKRPGRSPESYRTKHLADVAKPLFIFQGIFDEYGAPSPWLKSMLPPHAQIIGLGCDHDYNDVDDAELDKIICTVRDKIRQYG